MGEIVSGNSVSFILVFLEGVLSFFSPCVIPLIPVYMSYLAGNAKKTNEEGTVTYERKTVFFHTLFFVLGISFAFFILGMSFTMLGRFFGDNQLLFTRIGGIIIVLLGLFQLGVFDFKFLQRERKFRLNLSNKKVTPFMALIMGFTFSFAWTPCVGPALSSVLIMASGAKTTAVGNILVLIYALGFVLPFLFLGLFTTQVLTFLQSRKNLIKYAIKVGGIILIIMGIMTFTGWMNGISGYLNSLTSAVNTAEESATKEPAIEEDSLGNQEVNQEAGVNEESQASEEVSKEAEEEAEEIAAFDFTLTDQYGETHTLSDYKGKVVFLNFWATWCPPCKIEMPHIEELYQEYNLNEDEVVILGIANPKSDEYPNSQDGTKEEITEFLETNGYTFPTVFDESGEMFRQYYISAFPTTFMIDKDGIIAGYVAGMLTKDIMINIIDQTIARTE